MAGPVAPLDVAGRYVLGEVIGEGGMARVRLGVLVGASGFRRLVAMKQATTGADDPKARLALAEEARLASRISHLNVVAVYEVLEAGGDVMIVMEWIHGVSLAQLLFGEGPPLPLPAAAGIVVDMLRGLSAAHEARVDAGAIAPILHRDVSPENVLVGQDGVSRLTDFGIARHLGTEHHTRTGRVRGKAGYLAPELLRGEPATVQSDLYSAAVVAWEAFAGRRLYTSKNPAKLWMDVMNAREAPSLRSVRDDVPPELDELLREALARDPASRPKSAQAFVARLEAIVVPASQARIGEVVATLASAELERRADLARALEHVVVPADAAPTQLFSSIASEPREPPARAPLPVALTLAIAAAVIGLGLAVSGLVGSSPAATRTEPPAMSSSPPPSSPVASAAQDNPPAASGPASSVDDRAHAAPRVRTPPPSRSAALAPKASSSCDPPYDVDESGHRHYRLDCIRQRP